MERLKDIFESAKFNHHIYGIESHGLKVSDIVSLLDRRKFSYVFDKHFDSLKINDVRNIRSLSVEKKESGSIFIISFTHINNESQNALLKLIEEPKANTFFFLIFPNAKKLLPTVLSRLELISFNKILNTDNRKIKINDFIKMNLNERFNLIKKMTGKVKKNEVKLDKTDLQSFLDDLEIFFIKQKPNKRRNNILSILQKSRKYMNANSASIKMIMENISIRLQ